MDAEDTEQDIEFNIWFRDLAGNLGVVVDEGDITDGSSVEFDNTEPVLVAPTLASSNDDTDLATIGDVITITIQSNEPLYGMKDAEVAEQNVANQYTGATNDVDWEVEHEVTGAEDDGYADYTYTAVDLAGNTTTVTSASSNIRIDNTPPVFNTLKIYSNNTTNTAWAKEDDNVTVYMVANETLIGNPTVSIGGRGGAEVTITNVGGDLRTYTAVHQMDATDTEGFVDFEVRFQNAHGLDGVTITQAEGGGDFTTDGSTVEYDRQLPTLSAVSISTDNDNTAYAKAGSIITLDFTAASAENLLSDPTVKILHNGDGGGAVLNTAVVSGSGANWAATYTAATGDREGTVAFAIDFFDYAGNEGAQVVATNDGTEVIFDETAPNLDDGVTITSDNTNDPAGTLAIPGDVITLSVTADDIIRKPTIAIAGNSATISPANDGASFYSATYTMQPNDATASTAADGSGGIAFTVDYADIAGNEGAQVTVITDHDADGGVSFDKQKPSFTTISIGALGNNVGPGDDDNHTRAKSGDEVTVTLISDEILKTGLQPTVTIAGNGAIVTRTATDNTNKTNTFTATYTMSEDTDSALDGTPLEINISNYDDPAGNTGDAEDETNDGTEVIFDMTDPVLNTVTIASNNAFSHWANFH
jgi:hypothetical protein